jgi:hypothetical protein
MLRISKSGSCLRTTSLNNLFAGVFSGNLRTVWGRSYLIRGNKANRIARRVCWISKNEIFETLWFPENKDSRDDWISRDRLIWVSKVGKDSWKSWILAFSSVISLVAV